MSLYRETRSTFGRRAGIAAAAAVVLLGAGFGIGRATAPETSLEENLASLRADASEVTDALELVPLHYESTNEATRQGARDQLSRARERFDALAHDLRVLDPERAAAASRAMADLVRLVDDDAPLAQVEAAAKRARRAVRVATGIQEA
jgi:hypothetical protein